MKTYVHIRQYLAEFALEWENMSDKGGREIQNTHFVFNGFFPECNVVYGLICKDMVVPNWPQMM